ncbi:MAG: insulinase family protein [Candidatus Aminicenantes bacterium]|nr:insulinase family protein [Candidatus Aminicenantes bacterium]
MINRIKLLSVLFLTALLILPSCQGTKTSESALEIDYEQYTLDNGLNVILHEDKSDPIVAVAIQYHVGSNREEVGKTGFAHLFEHMMFQESEHVGQDQFFKKIQNAGGTLNGGTSNDGTVYFEVVPKNALEMVLWLESDRLGFLRSKITQEAFANQQSVVMNEKRQMVDNRPYGHTSFILGKLLYPEGHPYSWQVIGSMEDLANGTLKDVHEFHKKWYRPNNATLVVAGDYDRKQTKEWIEKYFGEIPSPHEITDPEPMPVSLEETKTAYYEDNFAKSPELTMVFPTVEQFHPDSYALSYLGQLLTSGKKAPFYKVIVEEKKLAPSISGYQMSNEIAGEFRFRIRTFPNMDLSKVKQAIFESFQRFEKDGFTEEDLQRLKNTTETSFYNGLSSVLIKSFQLARYNEYAGSPDYLTKYLEKTLAVTKDDIMRVYEKYIKDKPYVMTNFVPKGKTDLVLDEAEAFPVIKEAPEVKPPEPGQEEIKIEQVESSFDRSQEPELGPVPEVSIPPVWKHDLANEMNVLGIEHTELPIVHFSITIQGGHYLDPMDKPGTAYLVGRLMMEGTQSKTPVELEEAIDNLGANISIYAGREDITIRANSLADKFSEVVDLIHEILLQPRWDEKEFSRIKQETIERINRNKANPPYIAMNVFNQLVYGDDHIFSKPVNGTAESIQAISTDDLKNYYQQNFSPSVSYMSVVGDLSQQEVMDSLEDLETEWPAKGISFPEFEKPSMPETAKIYFVDVPGARQSVIRIGSVAVPYNHPDYYPATVMNYKLGGSFNSFLNMILREEKGYTYGAHSGFSAGMYTGTFSASSSVHSQATFESVQIFKNQMKQYRDGISEEDLEFTKNSLIKSNAMRFETYRALLGMLDNIAAYGLPDDYVKQREDIVEEMTQERIKELAQKYIRPEQMVFVVVGDAQTQLMPLKKIGLGEPELIEQK